LLRGIEEYGVLTGKKETGNGALMEKGNIIWMRNNVYKKLYTFSTRFSTGVNRLELNGKRVISEFFKISELNISCF